MWVDVSYVGFYLNGYHCFSSFSIDCVGFYLSDRLWNFCYHAISLLFSNFVQHCRNLTKRCSSTIPPFFEIFWTIFLLYISRSSEKVGKLKNRDQIYQCIMGSNVSWYYSKALQANIILINKIITADTKPWHSPILSNSNSAIIKILYKVGYINLPCNVSFSTGLIKLQGNMKLLLPSYSNFLPSEFLLWLNRALPLKVTQYHLMWPCKKRVTVNKLLYTARNVLLSTNCCIRTRRKSSAFASWLAWSQDILLRAYM